MKLHAFDADIGDVFFRALTRDRARRALKRSVTVVSTGHVIRPSDWKYYGTLSTTGLDHERIAEIHRLVKIQGFATVRMPARKRHFYVFDLAFDTADIRIYSADKELTKFREMRRRLELSPKGHLYGGGTAQLIGEVDIPSRREA